MDIKIYNGKTWEVVFCIWGQEFLGNCIVSCSKESLSELTSDDWIELGLIEKELERVTKKLFNSTMYNFACLMNNAYRDNEKPHVHFHFIPRYKDKVIIFDKEYIDKHFGYNFWKWELDDTQKQEDIFNENERKQIMNMIKKEWSL